GLKPNEALVLIQKEGEIVLRKESDVSRQLTGRDAVWDRIALESLRRAWGPEDAVWDRIAVGESK
ncbi:MAG: hypothetical protein Q7R47_01445, partial [Candidatus Diapherotrites archaeon]|nr:hypothetical protein [Candidatus Diapherotrites archaeon]